MYLGDSIYFAVKYNNKLWDQMSSFQQCFFIKGGGGAYFFKGALGVSMIMVEVFAGLSRGGGGVWLVRGRGIAG